MCRADDLDRAGGVPKSAKLEYQNLAPSETVTLLDDTGSGYVSGIFITGDDAIYVTDSESGPDTGAHELTGIKKGIRIGSARNGKVTAFIEDSESTVPDHSGAEGVGVDGEERMDRAGVGGARGGRGHQQPGQPGST